MGGREEKKQARRDSKIRRRVESDIQFWKDRAAGGECPRCGKHTSTRGDYCAACEMDRPTKNRGQRR